MRDYVENFYEGSLCDPEKECIRKEAKKILEDSLAKLPEVQCRRIQKHLFDGKKKTEIAWEEGARESAVRRSLERAYKSLRPLLMNA